MDNGNRTLGDLLSSHKGVIYIRCSDYSVFKKFLSDAEDEGYRIGGEKPTETNPPWDIMLICNEKKLRYCGWVDHMAFEHSGTVTKIDYKKYAGNETDYYCDERVDFKLHLEVEENSFI